MVLHDGEKISDNPNVKLFLKGAYNIKQPQLHHAISLDPDVVLSKLKCGQLPSDMPTDTLVKRLALLVLFC